MHVFTHALYKNMCITESIIYYTINSHIKITQSALFLKTIYSLIIGSKIRHFTMYIRNLIFQGGG